MSDLESLDPTDNFGTNVRLYLKDLRVIQIEPCYNTFTAKTWLTDRGRQFYDSMYKNLKEKPIKKKTVSGVKNNNLSEKLFSYKRNFKKTEKKTTESLNKSATTENDKIAPLSENDNINKSWDEFLETVTMALYLAEFASVTKKETLAKYFTIFFENIGLHDISILKQLVNKFSFLKVRSVENNVADNDFEIFYQLNNSVNYAQKLEKSTLCLLVGCNPRYEGVSLNLSLKKRENKGNFKFINMNSQFELTYDTKYNNTSLKTLKEMVTGNGILSQELKNFEYPLLIFSTNFYKRLDKKLAHILIKCLNNTNIFKKSWLGLNFINGSLSESGKNSLNLLTPVKPQDLKNYSLLHIVGVGVNNIKLLKKVVALTLYKNLKNNVKIKTLIHTSAFKKTDEFFLKNSLQNALVDSKLLPTPNFFETDETFLNAEGVFCQNLKVFQNADAKKTWQIFRKLFESIKTEIHLAKSHKENFFEIASLMSQSNFKNYLNFLYFASINLKNSVSNMYLSNKTQSFLFTPKLNKYFRPKRFKSLNTKLNYWICDFYTGSKDEYSTHSPTLSLCSYNNKSLSQTFF